MTALMNPPTREGGTPTPPAGKAPRDVWSRRLVIALPIVAVLLVLLVANQVGGILIARDLREDYDGLAADAQAALDRAESLPDAPAAAADDPAPAAVAPEVRPAVDVALTLTEFAVEADVAEVPAWAEVTFDVTNAGAITHDAKVGAIGTEMLDPGQTGTFTVEAGASGQLVIICTVPGHESAGMRLVLPIAGEETGEQADEQAGGQADDTAMPGMAGMGDDPVAEAASPDNAAAYEGDRPALEHRDPTAPVPTGAAVHDIELVVEERVMQVAEDVWQEVWTFGGTVPGPTLRVTVGDVVNVTLRNPADSGVDHSIDFHASQVAWNDEMRSIAPGEELVYSFTATHAGLWMYHCGTAPALHHIGNGMFGAIIVEPEGGLPPVDREFVFVQSEYYLGPQGEPGDLARMSEAAAAPDLVVFNGTAGQYAAEPIHVEVGERIRTWVLNAGPSADSSFHVVGTIFDSVMKEGVFLDGASEWGSQVIDLSPAQGGFAEFSLAEDGLYPIVTHAFNHPGRGALGLFEAGTGGEGAAGGH